MVNASRRVASRFALVSVIALVRVASALPMYGPAGNQFSDGDCSTAACKCTDCHIGPAGCSECTNYPCFNANGYLYYTSGWSGMQNADPDGDGILSKNEMHSTLGSPGFPVGAEAVGCNIRTCSLDGSQACGSNINCTSTLHTVSGYNYYTYSFSCVNGTSGTHSGGGTAWGCTDPNECVSNPCGAGYTCAQTPIGPFWSLPGRTCTLSNACIANVDDCNTNATCNSLGGGSYTCTCKTGWSGNGHGAGGCVDTNECALGSNPCNDNGDTTATCTDAVAPATGYTCNCDTAEGYISNGVSCVLTCNPPPAMPASEPCGNGGTCTKTTPGAWTCACPTGFSSTGTAQPACVDTNACAGVTACAQAAIGNSCLDEAAPSTTYHCQCDHPAYVESIQGGVSVCVNRDECITNHCRDNGDTTAMCSDHAAPQTGYDCACSNDRWAVAIVGSVTTCVDVDECAAAIDPCGHGTCTNLPSGRGYQCACEDGYVLAGTTEKPVCVVNSCTSNALIACAASSPGNRCVNRLPPAVGYDCACDHPAYVASPDAQFCINNNECKTNYCASQGDTRARCNDLLVPRTGYACDCTAGWTFDGATCVDVDECVGAPCGKGTCSNTPGGYTCSCPSGQKSAGLPPTCVGNGNYLSYSVEPGSACAVTGAKTTSAWVLWLGCVAGALWWSRRRRRA